MLRFSFLCMLKRIQMNSAVLLPLGIPCCRYCPCCQLTSTWRVSSTSLSYSVLHRFASSQSKLDSQLWSVSWRMMRPLTEDLKASLFPSSRHCCLELSFFSWSLARLLGFLWLVHEDLQVDFRLVCLWFEHSWLTSSRKAFDCFARWQFEMKDLLSSRHWELFE